MKKIFEAFTLTDKLLTSLSEELLSKRLPNLRSNSLRMQLWCIVGARESYLAAYKSNEWKGFSCSLSDTPTKEEIAAALSTTLYQFKSLLIEAKSPTREQENILFDLYRHEILHHGQLIR